MPLRPETLELDLSFGDIVPERLRPMLPMPGAGPFDSGAHCFEVAWDGVRVLAAVRDAGIRLTGRALRDLTPAYPEVQVLKNLVPPATVVDGELIVADAGGKPDFLALQERQQAEGAWAVAVGAREHPITFVVYDLLYLRGVSLLGEPLHRRQALLHETLTPAGRICLPEAVHAHGAAFFEAARERGLEGIVAKRLDGKYHPGRRHPDWLLIRAVRQEDFVVVGFVPGRGSHLIEMLVVGSYDAPGFRPVGRVVGGFDAHAALRLRRRLDRLATVAPALDERWAQTSVCWVEPRVVVCVKFSEWDRNGLLRFPIYCGLRPEVAPQECVRLPLVDSPRPNRARLPVELAKLPF